ncbi:class 1a ribonucleoside-diphosphate reductase subunit alpha [Vibrio breoganii]
MIIIMKVLKRNGNLEELDFAKIHKVLEWAAEGLRGVSVSEVEMRAHIKFYDGMSTTDIHESLIKTAADLISESSPDYQKMAANLAMFHLRKKVYGQFTPTSFIDHISRCVSLGKYDQHILEDYSVDQINALEEHIVHDRDMSFLYSAVKQLEGKYLVQNRVTKEIYETPQYLYMLVAMCLFAKYEEPRRHQFVVDFYNAASLFKISLPTPIMSGVRTPTRQFSSCVLIECGDSLPSINATAAASALYVSSRAGLGINAGRIRGLGSEIRGGEAFHTGCVPFYKYFQTAVKCCSQGGVRGGAATVFYPIWHIESPSLLVLKNNKGTEETRVRHMDYGVQLNKFFYQRLVKGGDISLFSPHDTPGLYDAFFADQAEFERLYLKYEADESIRRELVPASELFSVLMQERAATGRIYIHNVDHTNTHSPFDPAKAPVRQSNLCLEIALPTAPLESVESEEGEIALCTLSAFNLGAIEDSSEYEHLAELIVRALDALLDYQDYMLPAARKGAMLRRALGVGVINYAYFLAKNGVRYSDGSALELTHEVFELIQYSLLKASVQLSKEFGACDGFGDTTYAQGILPIDTYAKSLDRLGEFELKCDWESLRDDIENYGLRNSTLTALMPSETSSQISNATNGIEPPRNYISVKSSNDGMLKQVVPEFEKYRESYELLWSIPNNEGYLNLVGIMQKFVDQAISANTNYDPSKFAGEKVPLKVLYADLLLAYKNGIKTLYYHNTRDGAEDTMTVVVEDEDCAGGACKL